jgi:hypothetical protein
MLLKNFLKLKKLLLKDKRVDPSANNNLAIMEACSIGNFKAVKLLLKDKRVNGSLAIPAAKKKVV